MQRRKNLFILKLPSSTKFFFTKFFCSIIVLLISILLYNSYHYTYLIKEKSELPRSVKLGINVPVTQTFTKPESPKISDSIFYFDSVYSTLETRSDNLLEGRYRFRLKDSIHIEKFKVVMEGFGLRAAPIWKVERKWAFKALRNNFRNLENIELTDTILNNLILNSKNTIFDNATIYNNNTNMGYMVPQHVIIKNETKIINSVFLGNLNKLEIISSTIKNSRLPNTEICSIFSSPLDSVIFNGANFIFFRDTLSDVDISFNNLILNDITFNGSLKLHGYKSSDIFRTNNQNTFDTVRRAKVIVDYKTDLNRLTFDSREILFVVNPNQSENPDQNSQLIKYTYQNLIKYFYNDAYERKFYDVPFRKIIEKENKSYITSFFYHHWNYYGYNRDYIWSFSCMVIIFFFCLNLLVYPDIVQYGYTLEPFEKINKELVDLSFLKKLFNQFFYCFLYTIFVFWIFKINYEKIDLHFKKLVIWVIIQHVVGIILLAFIANSIFQK